MPITINGSGTVTGITAGGLPDGVITTDDIAAGAVTDAKVNASAAIADSKLSGTTCKAWVNFNGTGAITASGNVSSVTKHSTGNWTVNFTNAMPDNKYANVGCNDGLLGGFNFVCQTGSNFGAGQRSTTACSVAVVSSNGAGTDTNVNHWAFFR